MKPISWASAAVRLPRTQKVLSVPKEAVFTPPGSPSAQVFIVQDGAARLRVVQAGPPRGALVPIASGLEPGDRIITNNQDKLFDGQPVAAQ